MDREDNDAKKEQMLNDENTYLLFKKDPTISLETKMNSHLLHLMWMVWLSSDVN